MLGFYPGDSRRRFAGNAKIEMTTIFVYEYCTAQGLGRHPSDPAHSLWREGRAMRDAVVADFRAILNVTVRVLELGPRSSDEQSAFLREVQSARGHS